MTDPLTPDVLAARLREFGRTGCPMNAVKLVAEAASTIEEQAAALERLREALGQTDHFIMFTDDGWSVEHLVSCRPDMTACPIHGWAQSEFDDDSGRRGRFRVVEDADGWWALLPETGEQG